MSGNVREMVRTIIQTQVVQALNDAPEAIEKLVKAALSEKVDQHGKPSGYGNIPYLDWMVGDEIRSAARRAVVTVLQEKAVDIEAAVRAALAEEDIAKAVAKAVVDSAERSWSISVKFESERDHD